MRRRIALLLAVLTTVGTLTVPALAASTEEESETVVQTAEAPAAEEPQPIRRGQ